MALTKEPAKVAPQGIPHGGAPGEEYLDYKVKTDDSLDLVAKRAGTTWEKLAEFNYGTKIPKEINWYLHEYVGCTKETKDTYNYMFNTGDDPGIVHIPVAYKKPEKSDVNRAVKDNKEILSTLKGEPPTMEVQELAFPEGFTIRKWDKGPNLSKTVWKKTGNPNLASAFIKGQTGGGKFKANIKIKLVKGNHGTKTFSVRATGIASNGQAYRSTFADGKGFTGAARDAMTQRLVLKKDNVTWAGDKNAEMEIEEIEIAGGQLPDKVMICNLPLCWAYSYDGKTWVNMGRTGPHKIFLVVSDPLAKLSSRTDDQALYNFGLGKACGYVNGDGDNPLAICKEIQADTATPIYNPFTSSSSDMPLKFYSHKGGCVCLSFGQLMHYLCQTIGLDADLQYVYGGQPDKEMRYTHGVVIKKTGAKATGTASFRVKAPKKNKAPVDSHFYYHSVVKQGASQYDPTYAVIWKDSTADEVALKKSGKTYGPDKYALRTAGKMASSRANEGWRCPHTEVWET